MRLSDFDYELPADLIAQEPTPERAGSRLLVVDRQSGHLSHCSFLDVLQLLPADCLLVLNDTRVFPARLRGRKESGGSLEVLLLRRLAGEGETWEVLCKGGQNVRAGARLWFAPELWATWLSAPYEGRGVLRLFPQEDLYVLLERLGEEEYDLSEAVAARLNLAKGAGRKIIAVGTTTTRVLESACTQEGTVQAGRRRTDLFIYPDYRFGVIDGLITNFHLPRSTLLLLVSAFAGRDLILRAYAEAVAQRYRFYSYGDAMLIL